MQNDPDEIHVSAQDARAGSTPGIVRYVLAISLALVIVALSIIWITGAYNADQTSTVQDNEKHALAQEKAMP